MKFVKSVHPALLVAAAMPRDLKVNDAGSCLHSPGFPHD